MKEKFPSHCVFKTFIDFEDFEKAAAAAANNESHNGNTINAINYKINHVLTTNVLMTKIF